MGIKVCGSHSFPREDQDDDDDFEYHHHQNHPDPRQIHSAGSSPRRSTSSLKHCRALKWTPSSSSSRHSHSHAKNNNNPYSTRGLDKFTALLTEIDERRRSVYSQFNPDEISLVRFDYSNDNNGKPIVVKAKPSGQEDQKIHHHSSGSSDHDQTHLNGKIKQKKKLMERSRSEVGPVYIRKVDQQGQNKKDADADKKKISGRRSSCTWEASKLIQELKKPSYYFPATFVVVLILLALFGRSAAVICTSIGWYLLPSTGVANSNRRSFKRKTFVGGGQLSLSFKGQIDDGKRKLSSPPGSFKGLDRRTNSPPPPPPPSPFHGRRCGFTKCTS